MKKIFYKNIIFYLFISLLSGCSIFSEKSKEIKDWEDEILVAEDCGMDGLACCLDEGELSCMYGQTCCINPLNKNQHYCADNCDCGTLNAFCCEKESCEQGLICQGGKCLECGKLGNTCCDKGDLCFDNLLCYNNKCLQCGEIDSPCCENDLCNNSANSEIRIECQNDICKYCGKNSYHKCEKEPFCDDFYFLQNDLCLACGGFNQACCNDSEKKCSKEYKCIDGFCGVNR